MNDYVLVEIRYRDGSQDTQWIKVGAGRGAACMKAYAIDWRDNTNKWYEVGDGYFVNTDHIASISFDYQETPPGTSVYRA